MKAEKQRPDRFDNLANFGEQLLSGVVVIGAVFWIGFVLFMTWKIFTGQ